MIQMILIVALQMTFSWGVQAVQYGIMGFMLAYGGRKGWEAGRKGK